MTLESKPKYHHGDLRSALINATIEIITEHGIDSITMRRLSEWVGVSRTAAYRHFKNKEALLTATAITGFEKFSAALQAARLDKSRDEIERFREMGRAYLQFATQNPAYYRLMFGNSVSQQNEALSLAAKSASDALSTMVETLQQKGLIASDSTRIQAIYIWSLMHGLASLIINNKLQSDDDPTEIATFFDQAIAASLNYTG